MRSAISCREPAYTKRSFQLVAHCYELDKDLLAMEQAMFKNFRDSNDDVRLEPAVDVLGCMHENELNDFLPHFAKAMKVLSIIPATSCTPARSFSALRRLKSIPQKHDGAVSI